jgi:hypothetical protein
MTGAEEPTWFGSLSPEEAKMWALALHQAAMLLRDSMDGAS